MSLDTAPLLKHAKKYGTDGVMETAVEAAFSHAQLCELLTACDQIDAEHARASRRFATVRKHRLTIEQRVNRLLGIEDEQEEA